MKAAKLFLAQAAVRAPKLASLILDFDFSASKIVDNLLDILPKLENLRVLEMPRYTVTGKLFVALAGLPRLEVIGARILPVHGGVGDDDDIISFHPTLGNSSFTSLKKLDICATLIDLTKYFMQCGDALPSVDHLQIISPKTESADDLERCLTAVSVSWPTISILDFFLSPYHLSTPLLDEAGTEADKITAQTLNALQQLKRLISMELLYHRGLQLSEKDLLTLLEGCSKNITDLILVPDPFLMHEESQLALGIIPHITAILPKLTQLGLFFNGSLPQPRLSRHAIFHSAPTPHTPVDITKSAIACFRSLLSAGSGALHTLDVGYSPANTSTSVVAVLLSFMVSSETFSINSGPRWFADTRGAPRLRVDETQYVQSHNVAWIKVNDALSLLFLAQHLEREVRRIATSN